LFLSHASLYILGDYRLNFCVFQLKDENAEDILDLARYAYSEEGGGGSFDGEIGDLRSLVC
jgi:hypothetical protein